MRLENGILRDLNTDKIIQIKEKDWNRMLRLQAIHEKNIADLCRQCFGMKEFKFDGILKEIAEDFDVNYEDLVNVQFARFENDD
jgi:hypothetical protein